MPNFDIIAPNVGASPGLLMGLQGSEFGLTAVYDCVES